MSATHIRSSLVCVLLAALLCRAATGADAQVSKRSLVGAWKLVGIHYAGPKGPVQDPFYQEGSTGIIIYDPSGWMSVHISAPHRGTWEGAAARVPPSPADPDVRRKAVAFDTYYSYFGTWDFDPKNSTVTHHLKASLVPSESGVDYTQQVTLERGRLVFTNRSTDHGEERIRKKVWERAVSAE